MILQRTRAPHIRTEENITVVMRDVAFALCAPAIISIWYYGFRALMIILVSVLTCFLADTLCLMVQKKKRSGNISPLITGMIIALMMPASIPYSIVVAAGLFAIFIGKHPFGGLGNNIFNPACVGIAFAMISWNSQVMSYPDPFSSAGLPIFGEVTAKLSAGPTEMMKGFAMPISNNFDLLSGNFSGPMGTTNVLVIAGCALFLLYRGVINWRIPVSFLGASAIAYMIYPRLSAIGVSLQKGIALELCVGALFFCTIFVASDPVTSPTFRASKIFFGAGCGFLTMIFRFFGNFPEGVMFSILIMNALSGFADKFVLDSKTGDSWFRRVRNMRAEYKDSEEYRALQVQVEEEKKKRKEEANLKKAESDKEKARKAKEKAEKAERQKEEKAAQDAVRKSEKEAAKALENVSHEAEAEKEKETVDESAEKPDATSAEEVVTTDSDRAENREEQVTGEKAIEEVAKEDIIYEESHVIEISEENLQEMIVEEIENAEVEGVEEESVIEGAENFDEVEETVVLEENPVILPEEEKVSESPKRFVFRMDSTEEDIPEAKEIPLEEQSLPIEEDTQNSSPITPEEDTEEKSEAALESLSSIPEEAVEVKADQFFTESMEIESPISEEAVLDIEEMEDPLVETKIDFPPLISPALEERDEVSDTEEETKPMEGTPPEEVHTPKRKGFSFNPFPEVAEIEPVEDTESSPKEENPEVTAPSRVRRERKGQNNWGKSNKGKNARNVNREKEGQDE